jgi:CubicO group peptidase (beta-lactamase class C family)
VSLRNAIDDAIMPFVKAGGLTHYYAACGTLSEGVLQRSVHLPGGRTFFDLSSLTKALVITPLLLEYAKNTPLLDLKVSHFGVTASALSLLQHEAGVPFWRNLWLGHLRTSEGNRAGALARLEFFLREVSLLPGAYLYGDLGHMLLSLWLEAQTQQSLVKQYGDFLEATLQEKRSLLFYAPTQEQKPQGIPSAYCRVRGRWLCGEAHDENASALGGVSGHAGLFASGEGLETFLLRFLCSRKGKNFSFDHLPPYEASRRSFLGWQVGMGLTPPPLSSPWILGHQGFTGTLFWWMPQSSCFGLLLTNRTMGGRQVSWIHGLRQKVFSLQCRELGV